MGGVGLGVPTLLLKARSQIVGIVHSNKIHFLLRERARVARMTSLSTCLTCHARVHNLVCLLVQRLLPFQEKIHLGGEHIDTVNMVNALAGQLPFSFPTLVGSNLSTNAFAPVMSSERRTT